jgi:probable addiction module antidote protein
MPKRTRPYRDGLLEALRDPAEAAEYLNAVMEDAPEMFLRALRDVADARELSTVAAQAGVARESMYRMLHETGNPRFENLMAILQALGLGIRFVMADSPHLKSAAKPAGSVSQARRGTIRDGRQRHQH